MSKVKPAAKQVRRHRPNRARAGKRATNYAQLDALTRADLLAIARYFFGTFTLPDSAEGEQFLHGLLLKKLPATQVLDVAPWASRRGVDYYVDKANDERRKPDADMLGNLIEFNFDDLKAMKLDGHSVRHIAPCDAQRWELDEFWKVERRDADRERKKLMRKEQSNMPVLTKRAKVVHRALRETRWANVNAIMDAVDMRNQRNRRLAPDVLRVAVHRALKELVARGLAEAKTEIEHGVATRFARRSHVCGQDSVSANSVSDNKKASAHVANPIKTGTSRTKERRYFDVSAHLLTDIPTDTPVAAEPKSDTTKEVLAASPPSQPTSHPLEKACLTEELAQHIERLRLEAELETDQPERRSNR